MEKDAMLTIEYGELLSQERLDKNAMTRVLDGLDSPSGAVLVRGFPCTDEQLLQFGLALGTPSLAGAHAVSSNPIFDIEVVGAGRTDNVGLLIYSTTSLDFPFHTDEYREAQSVDAVITLCVRPDDAGRGGSFFVPLEPVTIGLSAGTLAQLQTPQFPTEYGLCAILFRDAKGATAVRYNRREIDRFSDLRGVPLSPHAVQALAEFEAALAGCKETTEILLGAGDCLILNNRTTLHGRTALSDGSSRLVKRLRLHRKTTHNS